MVDKHVTYHVVLFTKENHPKNRADQKHPSALTRKSLQQADLTRKSQAETYQESIADQTALTKKSHLKSEADQKAV